MTEEQNKETVDEVAPRKAIASRGLREGAVPRDDSREAVASRGLRGGAVPRDEAPQEEHEPVPTSAKAKRKPRQPKEPKQPKESKRKSKVITVDVGHTEYFDDPKTPTPPSEDLPDAEQTPLEVIGPPPSPALEAAI